MFLDLQNLQYLAQSLLPPHEGARVQEWHHRLSDCSWLVRPITCQVLLFLKRRRRFVLIKITLCRSDWVRSGQNLWRPPRGSEHSRMSWSLLSHWLWFCFMCVCVTNKPSTQQEVNIKPASGLRGADRTELSLCGGSVGPQQVSVFTRVSRCGCCLWCLMTWSYRMLNCFVVMLSDVFLLTLMVLIRPSLLLLSVLSAGPVACVVLNTLLRLSCDLKALQKMK